MNLLLVDDHQLFLDGMSFIFSQQENITISGTANNGRKALEMIENESFDLVMMDINMPELNGFEATKMIKSKFPKVKILIVSMLNDYASISKLLKAGADGYVMKNTGKDELLIAIETIMKGEVYVGEEVKKGLFLYMTTKKANEPKLNVFGVVELTNREKEILKLISEGMTNNEMADKLFLSPKTIDTHRTNLLQKLGLKNTAALIKYAVENGLLD
jgi:DNA-binding NarL/FixJ family response regulator